MTQVSADTPKVQHGRNDPASYFPRRSQTRAGKVHLVTLAQLDGRTAAAREARNLIAALTTSLGEDLTVGEQQLVVRAAMVGAIVSDFEARWIAGEQMPLADYLAAVNVQRRILATLGLQRRQPQEPGLYERGGLLELERERELSNHGQEATA